MALYPAEIVPRFIAPRIRVSHLFEPQVMHARTSATLEELKRQEWFRSVGVLDTSTAEVVASWPEAIERCGSPEWQELTLEAANRFTERLFEKSRERFQQWNDTVLAVRPITRALVAEKTRKVIEENDLPVVFLKSVNWDILHLCMEAEYADVHPPGFFASQSYWYANGHFPCGWSGVFPNGKLIVF